MGRHFPFSNSYARLPERFFQRLAPTAVETPRLIKLNLGLATRLGLDAAALASPDGVAILAGQRLPEGAEPLAMAYAGHQFGHFVPQLGDGRAILLGEVIDRDGKRVDIQLKGAGPTAFSRRGDGRAALGPVLREYIVSEAMAALGVKTTRSLAAVLTGETVYRETALPGAVLTRVASSHIRVGTFQYFAAKGDREGLALLARHVIERHYPAAAHAEKPFRALLDAVIGAQAALIAHWLSLGFVHGVMNTDNMSIAGETIDYGPCAFLDAYAPDAVFSSIDAQGRYAYANQPRIGQWNLARLAECFVPLLGEDKDAAFAEAQSALDAYGPQFEAAYRQRLRAKIGLGDTAGEAASCADVLADRFLDLLAAGSVDFTLTFRRLSHAAAEDAALAELSALFAEKDALLDWARDWRAALGEDRAAASAAMLGVNPAYIPRNHRIEAAIEAALSGDFAPFEMLVEVLAAPYEERAEFIAYAAPPAPEELVTQTFCGT